MTAHVGQKEIELVSDYLLTLQDTICDAIEKTDGGAKFRNGLVAKEFRIRGMGASV